MTETKSDKELIELFVQDLKRRNMAKGTIIGRLGYLKIVADQIGLNSDRLAIDELLDTRPMGAKTRNVWLSHLNSFYVWGIQEGYLTENPITKIHRPKITRDLPRPIDDADLDMAIRKAQPVMKAWLLLGAYEGLRCQEIAGLNREDILYEDKLLRIMDTKGGDQRIVPLHPDVWSALKNCKLPASGAVFVGKSGQRYSPNHVSVMIGEYFRYLGIPSTPHSLRHWFATRLLTTTHDLQVVSKIMGHKSIVTTMIYADWDREVARAGVMALKVDGKKKRGYRF